jgi:hypothetical protein
MINTKKGVFLVMMSVLSIAVFSQNLVSKKGEPFLPEKKIGLLALMQRHF